MRTVSADKAVGKVLAQTIYNQEGEVLLHRGTILTDAFVRRLVQRGYQSIPIHNPLVPDLTISEVIDEQTRQATFNIVRKVTLEIAQGRKVSPKMVAETVHMLLESLDPEVLYGLSTLRTIDEYTFSHSVNVCILSLLIAKRMFFTEKQLFELGMGTLLHDIGKVRVPEEIMKKPGRLTEDEFEIMKSHTEKGYRILVDELDLSYLSAHVAYQHHERLDGSGYPRGLKNQQIFAFARIVSVADVFDATTSNRIYAKASEPIEAASYLNSHAGTLFDPECVRRFLNVVALYPNGTIVLLNNGAIGVVVQQNRPVNGKDPFHWNRNPVVRVVSEDRHHKCQPYEVNLMHEADLFIVRSLPDYPQSLQIGDD